MIVFRKSIRPAKIEWSGAGMVICLERGAVQIGLTFWITQIVLEKRLGENYQW